MRISATLLPHENDIGSHGLNSQSPGKRVWRTPQHDRSEINKDEANKTGRQVSVWLHRLRNEGGNALNELSNWDKAKLGESLDWIQKNVPAR